MKQNFTLFLLALAVATAPAIAQTNNGQPVVEYQLEGFQKTSIPLVVTGDPQLASLAIKAFSTHGAYSCVTSGGDFTLTFNSASANQVRVDIAKKGSPTVTTVTANGASTRDALYRAADAAVKATINQPGYFTTKLAFVSNTTGADELYTSDLFLGDARAITNKRATTLSPRWSPDGRRIIFTSFYKTNSSEIFQIDTNTLNISDYATYRGTNMGGRFSPDGSRVAMIIGIPGGNMDLYLSTPDGRSKPNALTSSQEAKSSPCFSPDGQRIVFAMQPGPQLYTIPVTGGTPTRVVTQIGYAAEPDWSRAKPNLIVFTTNKLIGVHNTATGTTRFITPKTASRKTIPGDFVEPAWLPDGRHIVCTLRPTGGGQRYLYILDTDEKGDSRATQISAIYAKQAAVLPQP